MTSPTMRMSGSLLEARRVDGAARQGAEIAERAIGAIRAGASDPDALMRMLLRVLADGGHLVPPSGLLRGVCRAIQREIRGAGHGSD